MIVNIAVADVLFKTSCHLTGFHACPWLAKHLVQRHRTHQKTSGKGRGFPSRSRCSPPVLPAPSRTLRLVPQAARGDRPTSQRPEVVIFELHCLHIERETGTVWNNRGSQNQGVFQTREGCKSLLYNIYGDCWLTDSSLHFSLLHLRCHPFITCSIHC